MGCDYYAITDLEIQYMQDSEIKSCIVEWDRSRHYCSAVDIDSDNEDGNEAYEKQLKEDMAKTLARAKAKDKILYQDDKWLIKHSEKYNEILAANIPENGKLISLRRFAIVHPR